MFGNFGFPFGTDPFAAHDHGEEDDDEEQDGEVDNT